MNHIPPSKVVVKARKDARVQRTRSAFRDALLEILEEQPFDQVTIRELSARAGTGYATFFRHYSDKLALLEDVVAAEIGELFAHAMPILDAVDTHASCVALCRYVERRSELWSVLLTGGAAGNLRKEFLRQAQEIAAARTAPHQRQSSWLPIDIALIFGVSATVDVLTWWLQNRSAHSVEDVATVLDRLVVSPILNAQDAMSDRGCGAGSRRR